METEQRCGNCGHLGRAFPWCKADKKGVSLDGGVDCIKWIGGQVSPFLPHAVQAPSTPIVQSRLVEDIETAHRAAVAEDARLTALRFTWTMAYHAGYLYGVHMRACGLTVREKHGLVANPYRSGETMDQWAKGYAQGFDGIEEEEIPWRV